MIPIFAWNRKFKKWEIFPSHLLQDLGDCKGFRRVSSFWLSDLSDPSLAEIVKKYEHHFILRRTKVNGEVEYQFVFLPMLTWHMRWRIKTLNALQYIFGVVLVHVIMMTLVISGLVSVAIVMVVGLATIVKFLWALI